MPISRAALAERFVVSPPATEAAIAAESQEYGEPLPSEFVSLLRVSNGLHTSGCLTILAAEGVVQRNREYEVQRSLPGYFMVGDDSGGRAVLLHLRDRRIYEVDMGALDEDCIELSAESLDELLLLGTSLGER